MSDHVVAAVTIDPQVDLTAFRSASGRPVVVSWADGERQLEATELRRRIEGTGAYAACFAADVPLPLALATAQQLDEAADPTGAVLLREPTPDLWQKAARAGIRAVLPPTAEQDDISAAVRDEAARVGRIRAARDTSSGGQQGRIIVVLSPKGGSGKTMVATNLSVALKMLTPEEVTLVDLDCVFGDVSSVLGLVPDRTIGQLAMLPSFDSTMLKVFLTQHPSGIHVLAGSGLPEEGEAVTPDVAAQIVTTLARDVPYVVVDTAAGLDERALAAVDVATDLLFIASLDVASIRNLGKEMDALDRLGLTAARRHFVLNRADARVGLEVADVESALGMRADIALPSSRAVPLSMNQGKTLVSTEPDTAAAKQLLALARSFVGAEQPAARAEDGRGPFRRRKSA